MCHLPTLWPGTLVALLMHTVWGCERPLLARNKLPLKPTKAANSRRGMQGEDRGLSLLLQL